MHTKLEENHILSAGSRYPVVFYTFYASNITCFTPFYQKATNAPKQHLTLSTKVYYNIGNYETLYTSPSIFCCSYTEL